MADDAPTQLTYVLRAPASTYIAAGLYNFSALFMGSEHIVGSPATLRLLGTVRSVCCSVCQQCCRSSFHFIM